MADPAIVLNLIESFRRSKAMFAAMELGIFDRVPATLDNLAAGCDAGALERLLDALVTLGLLEREGAHYRNSPTAEKYLRNDSPDTLAGYVTYSDRILYPMWGNLADAVREGTNRWPQTFGLKGPIFQNFFRTEDSLRQFIRGMHGFGILSSPAVVAAFDLSRFQRIVDLGGATGHLAAAACRRYPRMEGVVFDLPPVIAFARELMAGDPVAPRITLQPGDFFEDPLPPCDLYAVGRILHDWSEAKIHRLLARVFEALPAGGALLIAEKLLHEDKRGPLQAHMQSLNMLVCTEGKERTVSGYRRLLEQAGFSSVDGKHTGAPLDAVIAYKS